MPVTRKRENVSAQVQIAGPIQSGPAPLVETARGQARVMAGRANQYGQLMAKEAADKGNALAKAATFATGANGLPTMPANATAEMGRIAQNAYDATMQQRFAHQMTTAISAQIKDAENANMYDFGAFTQDAQERIDKMALDVPDGMGGMFQQISTGLLADSGISIGRRVAQTEMRDAASSYPVMVRNQVEQARQLIASGNYDAAQQIAEGLNWIDRIDNPLVTETQRQAWKDTFLQEVGMARMMEDLNVRGLSTPQLTELRDRMVSGDGQQILDKYFTSPNGQPRRDLMRRAASGLGTYMQQASARAAADARASEQQARVANLLDGVSDGSKKDAAALDAYFSENLNLTDPANPGASRPMEWRDWLSMDGQTRADLLAVTKTAGVMPTSLKQAMRRLDNVQDPAEMTAAFGLIHDMENSPNTHGQSTSLMGDVPTRVQVIYQMASDLHGDGKTSQEDVARAMAKVDGLRDAEWNPSRPDANTDEFLYRAMARDGAGNDNLLFGSDLSRENARARMNREVNKAVFDGVEALPTEKAQAQRLFETYYATGETFSDALELTRQSMEGRWSETKYMAGVGRSAYAPEKLYAAPPPDTIIGWLKGIDRSTAGGIASLNEAMNELPFRLLPGDLPQWAESDFGADRLKADPFALMADANIRELLNSHPALGQEYDTGRSMLVGGRDYILKPDLATGGQMPVYKVYMRGNHGGWEPVPLGTLDIRDQWKAFTEFSLSLDQAATARAQRRDNMGAESRFQNTINRIMTLPKPGPAGPRS